MLLVGADLKPSRLYKDIELKEPSNFAKSVVRITKYYNYEGLFGMAHQQMEQRKGKLRKKFI